MQKFLVIGILAAFFIIKCSSLVCFICDGEDKCDSKKNPMLPNITCPHVSEANKKAEIKSKCFKIDKEGKELKRGCTEEGGEKNFCADEKAKDAKIECSVCEKDACNEVASNSSPVVSATENKKNETKIGSSKENGKGVSARISVNFDLLGLIMFIGLAFNRF